MPPLSILIKPASGNCTMLCDYCFYNDITQNRTQPSYGIMTEKTLELVIQKALAYADRECTIAYQGGEPTLAGLDFFRRSIEYQKQYNHKHVTIHNAIQTNGYGLSEDWANFFAENRFLVGLSLDGTKETNDCYRHSRGGKGTYQEILKTAALFDRCKVEYNILTVVNARTAKRIDSIYTFYRNHGFRYLQFIPCLDPIGEEPGQKAYSLTPKAYGSFLKLLFDLWYRDLEKGQPVFIRQFENYAGMLLGYPPESCGMSGRCSIQNVVEADGSVYPCDFYVLDQYRMGNLREASFEQLFEGQVPAQFLSESVPIHPDCQGCPCFTLCRGGCRRHRDDFHGHLGLNYFCEAYRDFFEYAGPRLQGLARRLGRQVKG